MSHEKTTLQLPSGDAVLHGSGEGVAEMQRTCDVGRRDHNDELVLGFYFTSISTWLDKVSHLDQWARGWQRDFQLDSCRSKHTWRKIFTYAKVDKKGFFNNTCHQAVRQDIFAWTSFAIKQALKCLRWHIPLWYIHIKHKCDWRYLEIIYSQLDHKNLTIFLHVQRVIAQVWWHSFTFHLNMNVWRTVYHIVVHYIIYIIAYILRMFGVWSRSDH